MRISFLTNVVTSANPQILCFLSSVLAGSCLRILVLGGSLSAGHGIFEGIGLDDNNRTLYTECMSQMASKYSYSALLENLLNEQFPCHAEDDPTGSYSEPDRAAEARSHHRHLWRRGRLGRDGADAPAPTYISKAQREGRHIVVNVARAGVGSYYWVSEMARWWTARDDVVTPFDDGVDLVRCILLIVSQSSTSLYLQQTARSLLPGELFRIVSCGLDLFVQVRYHLPIVQRHGVPLVSAADALGPYGTDEEGKWFIEYWRENTKSCAYQHAWVFLLNSLRCRLLLPLAASC